VPGTVKTDTPIPATCRVFTVSGTVKKRAL
jgi:hypothetical protein